MTVLHSGSDRDEELYLLYKSSLAGGSSSPLFRTTKFHRIRSLIQTIGTLRLISMQRLGLVDNLNTEIILGSKEPG